MREAGERVLGDLGPRNRGPTLVVVGGMHGNEPAGVVAAGRVVARLQAMESSLRGRAVFLAGNLAALAAGRRHLDRDLNRAWTPGQIAAVRNGGPPDEEAPSAHGSEDREQRELLGILETILDEAPGPVYLLDLHTTSGFGGPFSTVADTLRNRALAMELPVPLVLGLEELVEGTLHDYLGDRGCVTVAFEGGQHEEPRAVDRSEAAAWIVLVATGTLAEAAAPDLSEARKLLRRASRGLPRALEMRYRHALEGEHGFRMQPGYENFQPIRRGEVVARDRHGPVTAPESARILMPLYQAQGEDGFFVVREFKPVWLHLSRALRHLSLDRVVHWLPGIARHPSRPGALVVNRRVARLYPLQILHLLGFRRLEEEGERLVVTRRG